MTPTLLSRLRALALALFAASLLAACATTPPPVRLTIAQTDRGVLIWLPDNVLFGFGKATVDSAEAGPYLDRVAELLKTKTPAKILLEGHSDNVGADTANLALSERRAQAVRNELLQRGIAGERMSVAGYGKTRPLAPNDSELGRKMNRRVELILVGETLAHITRGEPANAFETAFDQLRQQVDQPLPK